MFGKNNKILTSLLAVFLFSQLHCAIECGEGHEAEAFSHGHVCLVCDMEAGSDFAVAPKGPQFHEVDNFFHPVASHYQADFLSASPREPPVSKS